MFNNKRIKELELSVAKLEGQIQAAQKQQQLMQETFKAWCQKYIDKSINRKVKHD